jgi:hypothetical protein
MTYATTTTKNRKRTAVEIPAGFPHPHRLADMQLFAGVLGIAPSTFHPFMAEGRLPTPIKIGRCTLERNRRCADRSRRHSGCVAPSFPTSTNTASLDAQSPSPPRAAVRSRLTRAS